jgi:hypothetical protein
LINKSDHLSLLAKEASLIGPPRLEKTVIC